MRVTRGAYVSRAVPLTLASACRAAERVLPRGSVFSHLTAAGLLGAPVPHVWPLEIDVPPGSVRPQRRRIRTHVRNLRPDDAVSLGGVPVTSGAQTLLDLSARLAPDELVAVGDALFRGGHLDQDRLDERLGRATGSRGVILARRVAPLLTPLAASRPESIFRYWLVDSDLPDPQPQVPVLDRWGQVVAHSDLGYARWKVALEYEGRQHAERIQFARDLERYSLMAADGWLVLRFGAPHLHRRDAVVDRVAGALRSRGARW
ncbi:MAG: hypothetical protein JWQ45_99 [Blastococcus sp.]|nr:hypothetical protein [Blastococcus sp.]